MKIRKGDQVQIISGKDKGKKGTVSRTLPSVGKIVVDKINVVKRHSKPKREGEKGQIVEIAAPLDASNAMVVCPSCGKASRIGYSTKGSEKSRVCKKCQKEF